MRATGRSISRCSPFRWLAHGTSTSRRDMDPGVVAGWAADHAGGERVLRDDPHGDRRADYDVFGARAYVPNGRKLAALPGVAADFVRIAWPPGATRGSG